MKPIIKLLALLGAICVVPTASFADDTTDALARSVAKQLGESPDDVRASPITGLYQVTLGGQLFYVSADGRYLVSGRVIDLETRENLTDRALGALRLDALTQVPEAQMIVFEPEGTLKHTLTTFTDIDCPYCRKMHDEMDRLNELGIRVRYLFFPRTGVGTPSYDKAVSVWCAPNQQEAMTRAKAGETLEQRECDTPIPEHMALAERLGLKGTPYTITDTGRVINGYQSANRLYKSLQADKQMKRQ